MAGNTVIKKAKCSSFTINMTAKTPTALIDAATVSPGPYRLQYPINTAMETNAAKKRVRLNLGI